MLKNLLVLPDGTEVGSGAEAVNALQSVTLTECVNSGTELTLGSVCAAMLEATLLVPNGNLTIAAGTEVTLYKVDDAGSRTQIGLFTMEKPTRATANTMKLTGYDRVSWLDKDLTGWLSGLDGWPYDLLTFAGMVCQACGLTLAAATIPNATYPVQQFSASPVTGRQIMAWIGEICCRFCRAKADGQIEFAWYTPAAVSISPTGASYYYQGTLSYEAYQVAPIDAVQLRLADSASGALWPEAADGANSYIITGNPILLAAVTEDLLPYLTVIENELAGVTYTPCKVSIPATLDIHGGNTVQITDKNGVTITAYVMTKTQSGQKDTLEGTGSARRDSVSAVNNPTDAQKLAQTQAYADSAAQRAVDNQTQTDIFNKLTNNGEIEGLFMKDGQLYINASYLATGIISSADGTVQIDLGGNKIRIQTVIDSMEGAMELSSDGIAGYGKNAVTNALEQTLKLQPGFRTGEITYRASSLESYGGVPLFVVAYGMDGASGNLLISNGSGQIHMYDNRMEISNHGGEIDFIGPVGMIGNRITNLGDPDDPYDAATKFYVDSRIELKTASASVTIAGLSVPVNFVKYGRIVTMTLSAQAGSTLTAVQSGTLIPIPDGFAPRAELVTGENTTAPLWGRGAYKPTIIGSLSLYNQSNVRIYWDTTDPKVATGWTIGASMVWIADA